MSGLFGRKKKLPLVVPLPPHEGLPTFPSPPEVDLDENGENRPLIEDSEFPHEETHNAQEPDQSSTFVKIDTFQSVVNDVQDVRSRLEKSGRVVVRLEEVQEEQNNLFKSWHSDIKTVHDKLIYVDEVLFKG